jgi:hypothetical protein
VACCAVALALQDSAAQSTKPSEDPAEVAALPEWPTDGKISAKLKMHFVFRDDRTGEIVVSYIEPSDQSRRTTFRYSLANRVDPHATVDIGKNSEKLYTFRYRLLNGPNAKTPIILWNIVGPISDEQLTISHPTWHGINGATTPVAPQALLKGEGLGAFLMWGGPSKSIPPGAEVAGFEILSSFRPGLTTAYAIGEGHIVSPGEVPEEAVQQLIPLERPAVNWKPFLTIGPRFGPGITQRQIVQKYQIEISDLMTRRVLDSSPYLVEVRAALSKSVLSGLLEGWPITAAPQSSFEKSLAKALDFSLSPAPLP